MATRLQEDAFCKNVALVETFRSSLPTVRIETIFPLGKMEVSNDESQRHRRKTTQSRANSVVHYYVMEFPSQRMVGLNNCDQNSFRHQSLRLVTSVPVRLGPCHITTKSYSFNVSQKRPRGT